MAADLPPSSRVQGLMFFAAAAPTIWPTSVDPVKDTFAGAQARPVTYFPLQHSGRVFGIEDTRQ